MRILTLVHGHPTFSAGGAERAAYSLFEHMKEQSEIESAVFAARAPETHIGHDAVFGLFRGKRDEILVAPPLVDHFTYQTFDYPRLKQIVSDLIDYAKPDIVHAHHFVYFGVEMFELFKRKGVNVVFTLHEYIPICHHFGQMIKTNKKLCFTSSPTECSLCFPDFSAGMFFLREQMLKTFLSHADVFIAPSQFLAQRYADWGVNPSALRVIENPLAPDLLIDNAPASEIRPQPTRPQAVSLGAAANEIDDEPIRLGFFGQINPFKGVHVLLEALSLLPEDIRHGLHLGIHGANLDMQEESFQTRIKEKLDQVKDVVTLFGSYDNTAVLSLMRQYDWIVIPSVWWENSPVVIQEAQLAGRPLICSRIGGMAEKVGENDAGLQFEPGNPAALAAVLRRLVETNDKRRLNPAKLIDRHRAAVKAHVDLYRELC